MSATPATPATPSNPATSTNRSTRGRRSSTRRPLAWRHELRRQVGRARTRWLVALVLAIPLIFVAAFTIGRGESGGQATSFIDLATLGSANFVVFTLLMTSDLLLGIVAAMFLGDTVPSEASWGSLRYLLTVPVPRARLLTTKLVVGTALTAAAVLLLTCWALLVGGVAYGFDTYQGFGGTVLSWPELLPRLAAAVGYLFVTVLQVGAIAFFLGVRTDAPLAAVGGAMLVVIVSAILDGLDTLGDLRHGLPLHYGRAWLDLFSQHVQYGDVLLGVLWSLLWTVLFVALGFAHFLRKDVLS